MLSPLITPDQIKSPRLAEICLLSAFLFFLPLYEAPKNVALYVYLIVKIKYVIKSRQLPKISTRIDFPLFAIFILSLLTVISTRNWSSGLQIFEFLFLTLLFLFVKETKWDIARHLPRFLTALLLGTLLALIEGLFTGEPFPSLRSVGHINQVAIFLTISYIIFAASTIYETLALRNVVLFIAFTSFIFLTDSRNAIFSLVLFLTLYSLIIVVKNIYSVKKVALFCLVALISICALSITNQEPLKKQLQHLNDGSLDNARMALWRTSLFVWQKQPLLGYGVGSFREATSETSVKKLLERENQEYRIDEYFHTTHGHNLIFHWLVERGLIATSLLIFWLGTLCLLAVPGFFENKMEKSPAPNSKTAGSFLPSIMILFCVFSTLVLGAGNTTLHKEHGLLTIFFLGFSISTLISKSQKFDVR